MMTSWDNFFTRSLAIASLSSLTWLLATAPWQWVLASFIYYKIVVGLLGNQVAQHRYFSHKSFQTTKTRKIFLYFVSLTTGVHPLHYAIIHRHHHLHSDTEKDVHSCHTSFWDIFVPITLIKSYKGSIHLSSKIFDRELRRYYPWHRQTIMACILLLALVDWRLCVYIFLAGIGWNYVHMILFRIFLVHVNMPFSYRNFETGDKSYNNRLIQVLDIGEGLHNNHHAFPNRYDQAINPGEFDPAGWVVKKLFAR